MHRFNARIKVGSVVTILTEPMPSDTRASDREREIEMRSYVLDEISSADIEKAREYLDAQAERSSIEDLYWLTLPRDLLSEEQSRHAECQPYCVAIEVGDDFLRFEFLVRSRVNHRCRCAGYPEEGQREFVMAFADELIRELQIRT
jgi:hypothetical protein